MRRKKSFIKNIFRKAKNLSSDGLAEESRRERGSSLIGLITTMVIMSTLGTGLVYVTSTSTLQELLANNHARAYYLAESGGRYALSAIRDEFSKRLSSPFDRIYQTLNGKTFTVSSGEQILISSVAHDGGAPDTLTFDTTGITESGFLQAKRRLSYIVQPANQGGGGVPGETTYEEIFEPGFDPEDWDYNKEKDGIYSGGPGGSWGDFKVADDGSMQVVRTISNSQARFLLNYKPDFFYDLWYPSGSLSYDVQTKIRTWNEAHSKWLTNFMAGISFRMNAVTGADFHSYGAAFKRGDGPPFDLPDATKPYVVFWRDGSGQQRHLIAYKELSSADGVISPLEEETITLQDSMDDLGIWEVTVEGDIDEANPWQLTDGSYHSSLSSVRSGGASEGGSSILTYRSVETDPATGEVISYDYKLNINVPSTLTFWHRGNNFHNTRKGYVEIAVNDGDWDDVLSYSSVPIYWDEVQLDLSTVPGITFPCELELRFRYENSSKESGEWFVDDVSIVTNVIQPHLVDWSTLLVRVIEETSPNRVNRFAIFFGSPEENGSGGNQSLIDQDRFANPLGQANWPPKSPVDAMNPGQDKFTLVSGVNSADTADHPWYWADDSLATSGSYTVSGCTYTLVNGGILEPYAIFETSCFTTDTYTVNSEIGLHAFGTDVAGNVYFGDVGIRIPKVDAGAPDGSGFIIVSP